MKHAPAEILREYGPFTGSSTVAGVSFDGERVWFASGDRLNALDPESGDIVGTLDVAGDAGTAFDGRHLFQIAEAEIRKVDPATGAVLATIPAPGDGGTRGSPGPRGRSGSASTAAGASTRSTRRPARCCAPSSRDRFVTGVTWVEGELWHGTWEGDDERRPPHRPRDRRGARAARHAGRHRRLGDRVGRRRPVLLRQRGQGEGAGDPPAESEVRPGRVLNWRDFLIVPAAGLP